MSMKAGEGEAGTNYGGQGSGRAPGGSDYVAYIFIFLCIISYT